MHERSIVLLLLAGLASGACTWGAPAWGADPALKETLGKVQSGAGSKAVEDLIEKLKGGARKAPPSAPAAAPVSATPPAPVATPAPTSPQTPPDRPAAEAAPVAPDSKPTPPATDAPAIKPDEAVRRADLNQAPSIDLEIFFAYKSAEITPEAAAALAPLGRALSDARLAGDFFFIAGHTDSKGGAEYNLALSQKRAEAVRQHLITTFGIDGAKLAAKGMGFTHLKVPGQPLAAENRRVQIVNLSKGEPR